MARVDLQRRAAIGEAKRASSNPSYFEAIDRGSCRCLVLGSRS